MAIRELDNYSPYAVGAGCFFYGVPRQKINDPETGQLRRERVWSSDREVSFDIEGETVEFGEQFATELAHALGWISPKTWKALERHAVEMEKLAEDAQNRATAAEEASLTNVRQAAEALVKVDDLEERNISLQSQANSLKGTIGQLKRQIAQLEAAASAKENFGDR